MIVKGKSLFQHDREKAWPGLDPGWHRKAMRLEPWDRVHPGLAF
jgi:hypothetical protein